MDNSNYEVIIIGGSYAGLSAAMTLGRSLRKTLLIDNGKPCNRFTPHSHNFLTQDGKPPEEISSIAKEQVAKYQSISFQKDLAVSAFKGVHDFEVVCESGRTFKSQKLIFASGIMDILPETPGFSSCWGKTIIHCPYCHGYEFRGMKTGLMANGDAAMHLAPLIKNLSENVVVLTNGPSTFAAEQAALLQNHGISIVEKQISEFQQVDGQLKAVVFMDNSTLSLDGMYAKVDFAQSTDLPESMGCELTEQGYIQVNEFSQTTIEGIYACGDNSSPMRSVANAVAKGNFVGAVINMELAKF